VKLFYDAKLQNKFDIYKFLLVFIWENGHFVFFASFDLIDS